MAIIDTEHLPPCDWCDNPAEYRCDWCGWCYCADCGPWRPDDAPDECCPECIQTSEEECDE